MADDPTANEVAWRLQNHEQRTDRIHGEMDTRIANLARDTVSTTAFAEAQRVRDVEAQRLEREHNEDLRKLRTDVIGPLRERVAALEKRPGLTVGRIAVIATAVIALGALLVQAYGTLRGAGK